MRVLLTNDDGVDSDGLAALRDALVDVGDVTVVAPAENQSGVGRRKSYRVGVDDHEWGYVVDGTPVDCVALGLRGLDAAFDVVVSGCNPGPNVGAHNLGRSGTVGAAVEAAYLGTPGVAVSLYDPAEGVRSFDVPDYADAARLATRLAEHAACEGLDSADCLNVNAPAAGHDPEVRVTRPGDGFDVRASWDGGEVAFEDAFYDPILPDDAGTRGAGDGGERNGDDGERDGETASGVDGDARDGRTDERDIAGTDLGALAAGAASVSPLSVGHERVAFDLPPSVGRS